MGFTLHDQQDDVFLDQVLPELFELLLGFEFLAQDGLFGFTFDFVHSSNILI
jgi:hypothetical protein